MNDIDMNLIKVVFPNGKEKMVQEGISLIEISKDCEGDYISTIVAAKVNNDIKELNFHLYENSRVEFLDLTTNDGLRIYRRSLYFLLIKAASDIFPERKVTICHSISKGIYCEIKGNEEFTEQDMKKIDVRMRELVKAEIPFVKRMMSSEDAKELFKKSGRIDRYQAIEHRRKPYVTIYNCDGLDDYFYGYMVPHTGYIKSFELKFYSHDSKK